MEPIDIVEEDEIAMYDELVGTITNGIYAFTIDYEAFGKVKNGKVVPLTVDDKIYLDTYHYRRREDIETQREVDQMIKMVDTSDPKKYIVNVIIKFGKLHYDYPYVGRYYYDRKTGIFKVGNFALNKDKQAYGIVIYDKVKPLNPNIIPVNVRNELTTYFSKDKPKFLVLNQREVDKMRKETQEYYEDLFKKVVPTLNKLNNLQLHILSKSVQERVKDLDRIENESREKNMKYILGFIHFLEPYQGDIEFDIPKRDYYYKNYYAPEDQIIKNKYL